jgi:predicted esterase
MTEERSLAVGTHGRYLVVHARTRALQGAPLLVGFHGYAESAAIQLERLTHIPGADRWTLVSIQGLHRFYRGRGTADQVVASWMTRQDRELMMADNLAYVSAVIADLRGTSDVGPVVFAGFSQGAAMAFRSAARSRVPAGGIISLGGDVPPELTAADLGRVPAVLLGRGERDEIYKIEVHAGDQRRLESAGVELTAIVVPEAGHDWTPAFSAAAGAFLERVLGQV